MVNPAFEYLKVRLVGSWSFVEDNETHVTTFEAVSHGNALLEKNSGFIAVYHPDGADLVMTLYTRDANQPRLRSMGTDPEAKSIHFAFRDITNWVPGTERIDGLEIVFTDDAHVTERWETLQPDGTRHTFDFDLVRKKS